MSKPFLSARWKDLILVNYEIPAEKTVPYLPKGLEVDLHEGKTYASLVAFKFEETAVLGVKWPGFTNFLEINLRLYVARRVDGETRRAVVFVKEIVPSALIAGIARVLYGEPYEKWRMDLQETSTEEGGSMEHLWSRKGVSNRLAIEYGGPSRELAAGSHEEFIAEHYWGYTSLRDGRTGEYEVKHPPWLWRAVEKLDVECDFGATYGSEWAFLDRQEPASVFLALGSEIEVMQGGRF